MIAVDVAGVSKKFNLAVVKNSSIKERIIGSDRGEKHPEFWALKNIDLQIIAGETVGMLGHNGSGKSTLLKCIAGILQPTSGTIRSRGRMASLLELGAGFHPDLTGRENVFINASFLGIPQKEIERQLDAIVSFAELEPFIDQQVKYYSSGMFVRLGFSVATNINPDVLLVDEVLAVGDEVFQQKCLDRIAQFQREGRTILFVTHGADLVRRICSRAIVLHHGDLVADDVPGDAIRIYREYLHGHSDDPVTIPDHESARDQRVRIADISFVHPGTGHRPYAYAGEPLVIVVDYEATEGLDLIVSLQIFDAQSRLLCATDTSLLGLGALRLEGKGAVRFDLDSLPFGDGAYSVAVQFKDGVDGRSLDWREGQDVFEVANHGRTEGAMFVPMKVNQTRT